MNKKISVLIASLILFGTTLAVFWPVHEYEFLNYDDDLYVTENARIREGITAEGLKWMWTAKIISNWHPLTTFSHMLDAELFGMDAGKHHLMNAGIHALNSALLLAALVALTGAFWRPLFVAALFALHPLHVESVAWVSERKDVLCAFFFILMLLSYRKNYFLTLLLFVLGLMSKPMLVTAPFVLLLIDAWPLERIKTPKDFFKRAVEKVPFFIFSFVLSLITMNYQTEAMANAARYPLTLRLINAVISCFEYLRKTFWPHPLAFFYPFPTSIDWGYFGLSLAVLILLSLLFMKLRRTAPYALFGWLWYLGMLVPVIGIVQVGQQAMGDRYTYLPLIGVFILLAWGLPDLCAKLKFPRGAAAFAGLVGLIICLVLTRQQLPYWKTSLILYSRALQLIPNNFIAHNNLGLTLASEGKFKETLTDHIRPITSNPAYAKVYQTLGYDVEEIKNQEAAIQQYFKAIEQNPKDSDAYYNLGVLFSQRKKVIQAIFYYLEALRLNPQDADAHNNIGNIFMRQNQLTEAIHHFEKALKIRPEHDRALYNLGEAYKRSEQWDKAMAQYQKAVAINPDYARALSGIADILAVRGKKEEAAFHYEKALLIDPKLEEAQQGLARLQGKEAPAPAGESQE